MGTRARVMGSEVKGHHRPRPHPPAPCDSPPPPRDCRARRAPRSPWRRVPGEGPRPGPGPGTGGRGGSGRGSRRGPGGRGGSDGAAPSLRERRAGPAASGCDVTAHAPPRGARSVAMVTGKGGVVWGQGFPPRGRGFPQQRGRGRGLWPQQRGRASGQKAAVAVVTEKGRGLTPRGRGCCLGNAAQLGTVAMGVLLWQRRGEPAGKRGISGPGVEPSYWDVVVTPTPGHE